MFRSANSTVFAPLLSARCLKSLVELGQTDREDFVLMEWIVAIELHKCGIVKSIFPITIEQQESGRKDGQKDGEVGLFSQSFFEQLRDGKVATVFDVQTGAVEVRELPDVVSVKTIAKAREFLGMLTPPVELSEELTVKVAVLRVLTFQAALLHFQNDTIDSLEEVKLARVGSAHGRRAKALARKHVARDCAERIVKVVLANREPEPAVEEEEGPLANAEPVTDRTRDEPEPLEIPSVLLPGPREIRHLEHPTRGRYGNSAA